MDFSVLMSCYKNDNVDFLRKAINSSFVEQTLKPSEFIIMVDGPVTGEIETVLNYYQEKYSDVFKIYHLPENKGLGNALRIGVDKCSYDYIIRMDSDDVSHNSRFEKLIKYAEMYPEYSVIGSFTAEFEESIEQLTSIRTLKESHNEILIQSKKRSPVSHVSVLLKKSSVIKAGNYIDFLQYEDYYLWIRMLTKGFLFLNIPEVLVYVRTDKNRYLRKGNNTYIRSTIRFQKFLRSINYISYNEYLINIIGRIIVAKIPAHLRKLLYIKLLRKKPGYLGSIS